MPVKMRVENMTAASRVPAIATPLLHLNGVSIGSAAIDSWFRYLL